MSLSLTTSGWRTHFSFSSAPLAAINALAIVSGGTIGLESAAVVLKMGSGCSVSLFAPELVWLVVRLKKVARSAMRPTSIINIQRFCMPLGDLALLDLLQLGSFLYLRVDRRRTF